MTMGVITKTFVFLKLNDMNGIKNFFIGIWNFVSQMTVELAWKAAAGIFVFILILVLAFTKNTSERDADLLQASIYVGAAALLTGAVGILYSLKDGRIDQPEREKVMRWTMVAFCLSGAWALVGILFGCTNGAITWLKIIDCILVLLAVILGVISSSAPVTPTPGTTTTAPVVNRKKRISPSTIIVLLLLAGFVISMYSRTMRATAKYDGTPPPTTDTVVIVKTIKEEPVIPPAPEEKKTVAPPTTPEPVTPPTVGEVRTWGEEI